MIEDEEDDERFGKGGAETFQMLILESLLPPPEARIGSQGHQLRA